MHRRFLRRNPPIFCAEIYQTPYWDANAVNPTVDDEFDRAVRRVVL